MRLDDVGIHAVCCGPNMWSAAQGSTTVFINDKPAVRNNDQTRHCGGTGKMVEGSPDVIIGGAAGTASGSSGGGGGDNGGASGSAGWRSKRGWRSKQRKRRQWRKKQRRWRRACQYSEGPTVAREAARSHGYSSPRCTWCH